MKYIVALACTCLLFTACQGPTERLEGYEVHGIDVSRHQLEINWDTIAVQEIDFVFMKATEGLELVDKRFLYNWGGTKKAGLKRGAYHFFHPTLSAIWQAKNFIKTVDLEYGDLPPVLDFEVTNKASEKLVLSRLQQWLTLVEQHYHIKPIIYTNQKLYRKYIVGNFDKYPIWMARYNTLEPNMPQQWDFWQYGNRGQLRGIAGDVDFNVFRGGYLELEEMCLSPKAALSGVIIDH